MEEGRRGRREGDIDMLPGRRDLERKKDKKERRGEREWEGGDRGGREEGESW